MAVFSKHAKIIPKDGASRLNFPEGFDVYLAIRGHTEYIGIFSSSKLKQSDWIGVLQSNNYHTFEKMLILDFY